MSFRLCLFIQEAGAEAVPEKRRSRACMQRVPDTASLKTASSLDANRADARILPVQPLNYPSECDETQLSEKPEL